MKRHSGGMPDDIKRQGLSWVSPPDWLQNPFTRHFRRCVSGRLKAAAHSAVIKCSGREIAIKCCFEIVKAV